MKNKIDIKTFSLAVNYRMEQLMPVLTPLGIVIGFLLPDFFIQFRPAVIYLFGIMTFAGALRLRVAEFGQTIRKPLPILIMFVASHVIMPLAAMFFSTLFFKGDVDTIAGFILLYSGPTAVAGFIWVSIYKGDGALCLTLILLNTLLAPLVVPATMMILTGAETAIDMSGIAVSLILMVGVPTVLGVVLNETSKGKIPHHVCPYLNPISKFCLILVIAANTAPVASWVRLDDLRVWGIAALCTALAIVGYIIAKIGGAAFRLPPEKSTTIFFSIGLRNISAVTTIAIEFFPPAAALPALLGIVFQQVTAAIMARVLLGRRK